MSAEIIDFKTKTKKTKNKVPAVVSGSEPLDETPTDENPGNIPGDHNEDPIQANRNKIIAMLTAIAQEVSAGKYDSFDNALVFLYRDIDLNVNEKLIFNLIHNGISVNRAILLLDLAKMNLMIENNSNK